MRTKPNQNVVKDNKENLEPSQKPNIAVVNKNQKKKADEKPLNIAKVKPDNKAEKEELVEPIKPKVDVKVKQSNNDEKTQVIVEETGTQNLNPPKKKPVKPAITVKKELETTLLSGKVTLNTDSIKEKEVEIKSTVVYFQPKGKVEKPLKKENYKIASQNKRFVPSVLAIQKGSSVTFPNMDRILHNVFSVSNVQKFDLGLYSAGKEKTVTFDNPGIIYVHCNVHHSMQADLLVLDTPYYTYVDNNGNFSLPDLPSDSGELYFWHPRAKLEKIVINESSNKSSINKTIDIVRKKIPKHLNKFGAPYRPVRKK